MDNLFILLVYLAAFLAVLAAGAWLAERIEKQRHFRSNNDE